MTKIELLQTSTRTKTEFFLARQDAELLKAIRLDLCVAIPQAKSEWVEDLRFLVGSPRQSD